MKIRVVKMMRQIPLLNPMNYNNILLLVMEMSD